MARHRGRALAAGIALATLAGARSAEAQSNEDLMRIIREQQRQIEELSRKVDALTGQTEAATEKADQAGEQAAAAAETAQKAEEESPDIKVKWGPGPTFSSKDGDWSMHVRGRLMVDGGALGDVDDLYKNDNGVELRAARLGIEGNFLQGWSYISSRLTSPTAMSTSRTPTSSAAGHRSTLLTSVWANTRRQTRWTS
jgi:hypothetical protein